MCPCIKIVNRDFVISTLALTGTPFLAALLIMSEEKKHFLYVSLSADKSCIKAIPPKTFSTRWMNRINIYGETKLHFAVKNEDIHLVRKLIKAGANVNKADYAGWTPLHEAVLSSHCEIVLELLKAGANINCKGYNGITPLQDAVQYDDYKVQLFLVKQIILLFYMSCGHSRSVVLFLDGMWAGKRSPGSFTSKIENKHLDGLRETTILLISYLLEHSLTQE
uniref:Uncharacterized protein n=1 Tax=Erpetoichthys calabaricus TaxID=27687 RepID=A0A8C4T0P7_ERPCA